MRPDLGAYQDPAALSSASPKKDKRNIYNVLLLALRSLHREIIIKISPPESPFIGTTSLLYLGEADESAGTNSRVPASKLAMAGGKGGSAISRPSAFL